MIAGQFEIADWLKPDGLIKTLRIRKVTDPNEMASKNPSFARLRRIWETTRKFWDDINDEFKTETSVGTVKLRLSIQGQFNSASGQKLIPSHTYEILLAGTRLSIVCVKEGEFLTAENLRRVARLLNAPKEVYEKEKDAATLVERRLQHQSFTLEEPMGYGVTERLSGRFRVINATSDDTLYVPALKILSEPRSFMALVPADQALAVAKAIKIKYETEMGKVRNRLPLTLGLVFAQARTPLAAVLDAGRRMLKRKPAEQEFAIKDAQTVGTDRVLQFTNGVEWKVPLFMGDGTTKDEWYPYYFVDAVTTQHPRYFQHPDNNRFLVHVEDLQTGDKVKVAPSYFDFEFLVTAARRFEISYSNDDGGKRRGAQHPARPYFLDQLEGLSKLWQTISAGLDPAQIKPIEGLIEIKREEWGAGEVFRQFVRDTLQRAQWKDGKRPDNDTMQTIVQAAVDGVLSDVVELYMEILK